MLQLLRILLFILISTFFVHGQGYLTKSDLNKKQTKLFKNAKALVRTGELVKAEKQFLKLLKKKPDLIDAYIALGGIMYQKGNYSEAEEYFQIAIDWDDNYDERLNYSLATVLRLQEKYGAASNYYQKYIQQCKENGRPCEEAKKHASNMEFAAVAVTNPMPFNPQALSTNINSAHSEYMASLSADGQYIIFTRRINNQEDFYKSTLEEGGFTTAQPLIRLNTSLNEGAHCISADGNLIVFTACQYGNTLGGCDLYYTKLQNGAWELPKNLGPKLNSESWDAQPSLSGDGKTLYFSSNRPGGVGGKDIWFAKMNEEGNWESPQNLGRPVNTKENESSPFIHGDGQTLYFRSDGHPGMGGYDLFLTRKARETENWSVIKNLGYPINTQKDEGALSISLEGSTAFYAGETTDLSTGKSNLDIFQFELPEEIRPQPTTFVRFSVFDEVDNNIVLADIKIVDILNDQEYFIGNVNKNGNLLLPIPAGTNYYINVSHSDYNYYSEHITLDSIYRALSPFLFKIYLKPKSLLTEIPEHHKKTKPTILKNIFFAHNSSTLTPESYFEIKNLAKYLDLNPDIKIKIIGHTDDVGQPAENMILSEARARAVYEALLQYDLSSLRISYEGRGETEPIDSNNTTEGRQRNRRTEFIVESM